MLVYTYIHTIHPSNSPFENPGYRPAFYIYVQAQVHLPLTRTYLHVGQIVLFSSAVVTIGFNTVAYTVLEDAGSVNVTASILNGTLARNVVVTMSTESGGAATGKVTSYSLMKSHIIILSYTSSAGTDYIEATITLMFDATISTQTVTVSILDDSVVEDTEFINLALTSVDSAVILNPATARINIEDVDSELTGCFSHVIILCYTYYTFAIIITNGVCLYSSYSMGYYKFRTW